MQKLKTRRAKGTKQAYRRFRDGDLVTVAEGGDEVGQVLRHVSDLVQTRWPSEPRFRKFRESQLELVPAVKEHCPNCGAVYYRLFAAIIPREVVHHLHASADPPLLVRLP